MSNSLVSIIIPTKNRVDRTIRALYSCYIQTYSSIEVIIVDDGSDTDKRPDKWLNSLELNEKINLIIVQQESSKGGGFARNAGVEVSSGEFVTFLDSDDVYLESTIKEQMSRHLESGEDIITYGKAIRAIYKNNTPYSELEVVPSEGIPDNSSVGSYLFCQEGRLFTPTLFMRRKVFDSIQFDSRLIRHQDYGFVLKAESLGYKFVFIDEVLFKWISDDISEGSRNKKISIDISIDFLSYYSHLLKDYEVRAYILKVTAPIAVKNFSFIKYYQILRKNKIKNHRIFFVFSIFEGLLNKVKAKVRLIF